MFPVNTQKTNQTNKMKTIAITTLALSLPAIGLAGPVAEYSAAPAPVAASSEISYNNFGLDYAMTWFDDSYLDDAIGGSANLEFSPMEHVYLSAGGSYQNVDTPLGTTDLWTASAGLGLYYTVANNFDLVVEGGALFYGIDNGPLGASEDDASGYAKPHLRAKFGDIYELHLGAAWSNINITNEWAGFGKLYIEVAEGWDLGIGFNFGDVSYQGTAGIRYKF